SQRPGIYFRVLDEGMVRAGDSLKVAEQDPERVPLADLFAFSQTRKADPDWAARALRVKSLMPAWRGKIADALEKQTQ
ncbi:MAG TPA: sulfurase, partial [Bdellovibrionota bacterium]|nr:sulfurase [Bdellovibrionota bacterium]